MSIIVASETRNCAHSFLITEQAVLHVICLMIQVILQQVLKKGRAVSKIISKAGCTHTLVKAIMDVSH